MTEIHCQSTAQMMIPVVLVHWLCIRIISGPSSLSGVFSTCGICVLRIPHDTPCLITLLKQGNGAMENDDENWGHGNPGNRIGSPTC